MYVLKIEYVMQDLLLFLLVLYIYILWLYDGDFFHASQSSYFSVKYWFWYLYMYVSTNPNHVYYNTPSHSREQTKADKRIWQNGYLDM